VAFRLARTILNATVLIADAGSGYLIQGALYVPVSARIAVQSSPAQIALILPSRRTKKSRAFQVTVSRWRGCPG
jgi:hypothetical protein